MPELKKALKREFWVKIAAIICVLGTALLVIMKVENMLVSFILAFVISYLFNPIVNACERRNISRTTAIVVLFFITGVSLGIGVSAIAPRLGQQITSLHVELPNYISSLKIKFGSLQTRLDKDLAFLGEIDVANQSLDYLQASATTTIKSLPGLATNFLTVLILAPFFAFFMLRDGRTMSRQLLRMVPNNLFELALNLFHQTNEQLGGFVRARLFESAIVGLIVWAGLAFISFPYALVLAGFAALVNLIPYVGPFIGAAPTFAIAFLNQEPGLTVALVGLVYFVAQLIDTVIIIPVVVAKIVNLHPVTVVLAIIIGGQVMGVVGMIISIPVTSVVKLTLFSLYNHLVSFRI